MTKVKVSEKEVREGLYTLLATLFKVLANKDRLRILAFLNPEGHTFSEIMFAMDKNPAVITRHLEKLQDYRLVGKEADKIYKATDIGRLALNATAKNIVEVVERALEIAKTEGIFPRSEK